MILRKITLFKYVVKIKIKFMRYHVVAKLREKYRTY